MVVRKQSNSFVFIFCEPYDGERARTLSPFRAPRRSIICCFVFVLFCFVFSRPGELADIFSGSGFEILIDEQGELPTRGSVVPANFFACRKLLSVP